VLESRVAQSLRLKTFATWGESVQLKAFVPGFMRTFPQLLIIPWHVSEKMRIQRGSASAMHRLKESL